MKLRPQQTVHSGWSRDKNRTEAYSDPGRGKPPGLLWTAPLSFKCISGIWWFTDSLTLEEGDPGPTGALKLKLRTFGSAPSDVTGNLHPWPLVSDRSTLR